MPDMPRTLLKEEIRKDWALEPLSAADHPMLKFDLVCTVPCPDCDGKGQVLDAPQRGPGTYWEKCQDCRGFGTVVHRIRGLERPFSTFVVGDLGDMAQETEAFLTRLLGVTVKIETSDE